MSIKTWSESQEQELIDLYTKKDMKDVHELAKHFSKGYRSVISKLVQLRIYEKPEPDEENKSVTVKLLLRELEEMLDIEIEGTNLSKKENLVKLMDALRNRLQYESS